jgi:hypothetical protein
VNVALEDQFETVAGERFVLHRIEIADGTDTLPLDPDVRSP